MEKMFVELVIGLYEEHKDTPTGSLVFTVCSTYTAPAPVTVTLQRAERPVVSVCLLALPLLALF